MFISEWQCFVGADEIQVRAGVEDEVVAFAVAVGLGDGEAEAGGFESEGEFGEFSAALGGEFAVMRGFREDGSLARRWASTRRTWPVHSQGKISEKRKGAGYLACALFLLSISRIAFSGGSAGHICNFIDAFYSYRYGDFIKFYLLTGFWQGIW
jgi:hypothetical protein